MTEDFIHYIWKYKLYEKTDLHTIEGDPIEILNPGTHNTDAGPDFFNARIKIGDTIWAGNVEVHLKSSDWMKHKHNDDKAYDNIILHVVLNNDTELTRKNGEIIPTLLLKFNKAIFSNYESLLMSPLWIPCQDRIKIVEGFTVQHFFQSLMVERLERKTDIILGILKHCQNSWEDTFYIWLARNFGFKLNAEPFELLAKSLPQNYLSKHKDSLFQMEALLFGQAGMLDADCKDDYFVHLKKEYKFLKHKFSLTPIESHLWKFLRLRPNNFPTLRISQFAYLISKNSRLFSQIIEPNNQKDISEIFDLKTHEYWDTHYTFGKGESVKKKKVFGKDSFQNIAINTIVPFLFIYGQQKANDVYKSKAISLLEEIKPEKNSIISKWDELGIKSENAFDTQALLELKNEYCAKRRCLNCAIGNKILTNISDK